MVKLRYYNTPNSWWYIGCDYKKKHWFSFYVLTKAFVAHWGENVKYIPPQGT